MAQFPLDSHCATASQSFGAAADAGAADDELPELLDHGVALLVEGGVGRALSLGDEEAGIRAEEARIGGRRGRQTHAPGRVEELVGRIVADRDGDPDEAVIDPAERVARAASVRPR